MTIDEFIEKALQEDVMDGDHTSQATIPENAMGRAKLIIKEKGIIAGIDTAEKVFDHVDKGIIFNRLINDGSPVKPGDIAFELKGSARSILTGERLALNFMQRMSGIATYTHTVTKKLNGLKTKVLDTRKTTPNFRIFEKEAVKLGGAENHRMGLYDMIMIKDNHIDFAGGIRPAIESTREYLRKTGKNLKIEIEVRDLVELNEVLKTGGVDRIMLDNFSPEQINKAVKLIGGKYETEASGGITMENIRDYAENGVDFISVGTLTHHVKSLDMSLKAVFKHTK